MRIGRWHSKNCTCEECTKKVLIELAEEGLIERLGEDDWAFKDAPCLGCVDSERKLACKHCGPPAWEAYQPKEGL